MAVGGRATPDCRPDTDSIAFWRPVCTRPIMSPWPLPYPVFPTTHGTLWALLDITLWPFPTDQVTRVLTIGGQKWTPTWWVLLALSTWRRIVVFVPPGSHSCVSQSTARVARTTLSVRAPFECQGTQVGSAHNHNPPMVNSRFKGEWSIRDMMISRMASQRRINSTEHEIFGGLTCFGCGDGLWKMSKIVDYIYGFYGL